MNLLNVINISLISNFLNRSLIIRFLNYYIIIESINPQRSLFDILTNKIIYRRNKNIIAEAPLSQS